MKSSELLKSGRKKYNENHPYCESELMYILEVITGSKKEYILSHNPEVSDGQKRKFEKIIRRRLSGEPLQYLMGETEFLGYKLFMKKGVFIPRHETEYMVEKIIKENIRKNFSNALEIGTGSGAISIALALETDIKEIFSVDISLDALNLAMKNIKYHSLEDRIKIFQGNLLNSLNRNNKFDLIVANPPYIPDHKLLNLDKTVREEPGIALSGGENGVFFINRILQNSPEYMNHDSFLYCECDQSNISSLEIPKNVECEIMEDQYGKKRFLRCFKK